MADNRIQVVLRDQLWAEYEGNWPKFCRLFWGSLYYLRHRVTRWWKLRPGLGLMQLLYIGAIVVGAALAFDAAMATPAAAPVATQPAGNPFAVAWTEAHQWIRGISKIGLGICAVIGVIYKTLITSEANPQEMERRRAVTSLLNKLNKSGAVDPAKLAPSYEARLSEICECIRRDAEEFLQIGEGDVTVLIVRYWRAQGEHEGALREWGRDRPLGGGYFAEDRHPLETFIYEPIRLRQSKAFHDLKAWSVRRIFGEIKADYRSVFCMPITKPGKTEPYATLTIKLKEPYLLWPRRDTQMERRLAVYVELINLFEGVINHAQAAGAPAVDQA